MNREISILLILALIVLTIHPLGRERITLVTFINKVITP
jgi:hypothetical protein